MTEFIHRGLQAVLQFKTSGLQAVLPILPATLTHRSAQSIAPEGACSPPAAASTAELPHGSGPVHGHSPA